MIKLEQSERKKIHTMIQEDSGRRLTIKQTKRYYRNENDIKLKGILPPDKDPLRNADNRVSHNYHQIVVDECAAYMFTYPIIFDLDNKELNNKVNLVLGDDFASISMQLGIEASNSSTAWLHYWTDKDIKTKKKKFYYAVVPAEQVIPVYSKTLIRRLEKLYRYYDTTDERNKKHVIVEVWDDQRMTKYMLCGSIDDGFPTLVKEETIVHSFGSVPFIEFRNNNRHQSDLPRYYDLINIYDKVMSGYINDLEDIQQLIYILENYGGTDLKEFLQDLKRYKAIKTESGASGESGGVSTLTIDIPVEARNSILEITKKQIYEAAQALQADIESIGNASGVTLKFFYRKLELKAALKELEFRKGFNELIRVILRYLNVNSDITIKQIWTRNMISNDQETAQIAKDSVGIIPLKLIWRYHPFVDDLEECERLWEEEQQEENHDDQGKVSERMMVETDDDAE